jgi:N-acyl homoserine lactone hydrolase
MDVNDSIARVSVVSTGQVENRPDHVASTWRPTPLWLFTSRTWTPPRPINAYIIEHRDGLVLLDTGQSRASVTDPGYFPSPVTMPQGQPDAFTSSSSMASSFPSPTER